MSFVVTINNPEENYAGSGVSATVPVESCHIEADTDAISSCVFNVATNVLALYDKETDSSNPLQLFSTVQITRDGAVWFYGFVSERPLTRDGGNTLEVRCLGKEGVLSNTLCPRNGSYVWNDSTTSSTLTQVSILPVQTAGDFSDNWYPAPSVTAAWYSPSGVTDTIDGAISDADTEIPLSTTYKAFVEESFVLIDTEWVFYTGYVNISGRWYLTGCIRGALGTTPSAHAGSNVTQKVAKQFAPASVYLEYDKSGVWTDLLSVVKYDINHKGGYFIFPYSAITVRATYDVYDVDSGALDVSNIVIDVLEADADYGGAGFASGDYTISSLGVPITRIDYSPDSITPYAWEFIHRLINIDGIQDEILFYYNHTDNKFKLENISQKAIPDLYITRVSGVIKERNIMDLYSGILIKFTNEVAIDRATSTFSYRLASGDGVPAWWIWVPSKTIEDTNLVSVHALKNVSTFAGPVWDGAASPSLPMDVIHLWFGTGTTPPTVILEQIKFIIATWGSGTWDLEVLGCSDYDTTVNDSATATWFNISPDLQRGSIKGAAGGSVSSAQTKQYGSTQFTNPSVNAIKVVAHSIPTDLDPVRERLYFHQFEVYASNSNYAYVQLVDTAAGQGEVEAALSLQKIRGGINASLGSYGSPRVLYLDLGAASEGAAFSIGAQYLRARLKLFEGRTYVVTEQPVDGSSNPIKPELGMTVEVDEGASNYTGIIQRYSIDIDASAIVYAIDVLDYDASVIV